VSSRSSAIRAALPPSASLLRAIRGGSNWWQATRWRSTRPAHGAAAQDRRQLPYNIATALLLRWLDRIGEYRSLVLMFQREVAERLVAAPRSPAYGRLSSWCSG